MMLMTFSGCKNSKIPDEYDFSDSKFDMTEALTTESLKSLAKDHFLLGVGLTGNAPATAAVNSPEYMAVVKTHFDTVTLTNLFKPAHILDKSGSQNSKDGMPAVSFDAVKPTLEWCYNNDIKMRGHTLVWHTQTPEWFFREGYQDDGKYVDKETMTARLNSYIEQVLTYCNENYPGVVYAWDVVNEAVEPANNNKDSYFMCRTKHGDGAPNGWYETLGEDYVVLAFEAARKYASPETKLFYNDYGNQDETKRFNIYKLLKELKKKELVDGVGLQGYWGVGWPSIQNLEETIEQYAAVGIEIHITELSVGIDSIYNKDELKKQADRYAELYRMFLRLDDSNGGIANITNVTVFGLQDGFVMYGTDKETTRFFDTNFQPKPCFYSVQEVLKNNETN